MHVNVTLASPLSPGVVRLHGQRPHAGRPDHHCDLQRRGQARDEEAHRGGGAAALQVPREEGGYDPGLLREIPRKTGPEHPRHTQADPPTVTPKQRGRVHPSSSTVTRQHCRFMSFS